MRIEVIEFDKSSDEDDEVESEAFIFRTKGKYIGI